jgi:hypothetical protein
MDNKNGNTKTIYQNSCTENNKSKQKSQAHVDR